MICMQVMNKHVSISIALCRSLTTLSISYDISMELSVYIVRMALDLLNCSYVWIYLYIG